MRGTAAGLKAWVRVWFNEAAGDKQELLKLCKDRTTTTNKPSLRSPSDVIALHLTSGPNGHRHDPCHHDQHDDNGDDGDDGDDDDEDDDDDDDHTCHHGRLAVLTTFALISISRGSNIGHEIIYMQQI